MLKNKFPLCCALLAMFAVSSPAQQNQSPPGAPASSAESSAPAANAPATPAANDDQARGYIAVMRVTGEAYVFQTGDTLRFALRTGSLVGAGQQISTGPKASVMLAFSNGATVTIGENAIVAVEEFTQTPFSEMFKMAEAEKEPSSSKTRLNLVRGEVLANVKKLNTSEGSFFEVKTPIGIAGIRGTTFEISYYPPPPRDDADAAQDIAPAGAPAFALVMLEGTISMRVAGRSQPIIVPEGKELVLDGSGIDPATGALLASIEDALAPAATPLVRQAVLLQGAQNMLAVADSVTMPSTASLTGMGGEAPASVIVPASTDGQSGKQSDAGSKPPPSDDSLFPAPDAQNPAPRLSPTDGTGK